MNRHAYKLLIIGYLLFINSGCIQLGANDTKNAADPEPTSIEKLAPIELSSSLKAANLDYATKQILQSYGATIRKYSKKYGFDWRLTLAVMKAESNFLDSAESYRGASGLMQIMPSTQQEVARVLNITDIAEPQSNIRAGIFYLSRLYEMFDEGSEYDRLRLTLAAYNAGPGRVIDAQEVAEYLHDNPYQWKSVKNALPLLSSRYYTLHESVWPDRKPKAGPFNNSRETVAHVEKIMKYYDQYRSVLN